MGIEFVIVVPPAVRVYEVPEEACSGWPDLPTLGDVMNAGRLVAEYESIEEAQQEHPDAQPTQGVNWART